MEIKEEKSNDLLVVDEGKFRLRDGESRKRLLKGSGGESRGVYVRRSAARRLCRCQLAVIELLE